MRLPAHLCITKRTIEWTCGTRVLLCLSGIWVIEVLFSLCVEVYICLCFGIIVLTLKRKTFVQFVLRIDRVTRYQSMETLLTLLRRVSPSVRTPLSVHPLGRIFKKIDQCTSCRVGTLCTHASKYKLYHKDAAQSFEDTHAYDSLCLWSPTSACVNPCAHTHISRREKCTCRKTITVTQPPASTQ